MKLSELWLREWVNPSLARSELSEQLTMAGLEVDAITPVAEKFSGVVVGKVKTIAKHPEANKLNICQVDVGMPDDVTIVCGAKNVRADMVVAAALDNASLPHNLTITPTEIRGVKSYGMLCSARELGLAEESEGLLELPADAPLGEPIWEYFKLSDFVFDIAITPNRGDCLSVLGLGKEIAALTQTPLQMPEIKPIPAKLQDTLTIDVQSPQDCPRYAGRIIRQVKADAYTPLWMQERLRRSGVRSISPIVDVMNYVMLELGQPMHAFDLQQIVGSVTVRKAKAGETLELLDGQTVTLDKNTLLIADQANPLAIAGVMGGLASAVTLLTRDIFLESAFFNAGTVGSAARHYNLGSESSYRFERGIDPSLQVTALERATALLLQIVGGQPGPIIETVHSQYLPQDVSIALRAARIEKILGFKILPEKVKAILESLGCHCVSAQEGWQVTVPARRSDITLEIDLIEELARLYNFAEIPTHKAMAAMQLHPCPEVKLATSQVRRLLCDLGYQEVITYSFIDPKLQLLFDPGLTAKALLNPMTSDMAVMRTSLWPSLVNTLLYNRNRQQFGVRLFEIGLRFIHQDGKLLQQRILSGLISGNAFPEQWGTPAQEIDFFDLKGDLEKLFKLTLAEKEFLLQPGQHPALHPGQSAAICRAGDPIGVMGALHPTLHQTFEIPEKVFLFEILLDPLEMAQVPVFTEISKFPEIRRDIAILIDRTVPSQAIQDTIKAVAGELLRDVNVFDVYQGKGVAAERKSLALSLTLQHASRTLVDEEVADLLERVIVVLKEQFAAELRG